MADLKRLIAKRGQIKSQLTRFSAFVASLNDKNILQLPTRLERVELLFSEFNEVQSQIEVENESETESSVREDFENTFFEIVAEAKQHLIVNDTKVQLQAQNLPETGFPNFNTVKLPTLNLPKFYGDYDKWLQFKDTFQSLVSGNVYLDDIQKFYYLLGCLQGDAAKLLQNLEVCKQNYKIAWDLLQERYENKPVIVQSHVKALFDMASLNKESHVLLRKLVDDVQRHLRALKSLSEPVETWHRILIFMISRKLDYITKTKWEEESISKFKGCPQMEDFITFLSNRCQLLEAVDDKNKQTTFTGKKREDKTSSFVTTTGVKCGLCSGSHNIYQCKNFQDLPVASRLKEVKKKKLCINCLRSNHYAQDCRSGGCKKCKRKHNTWLHRDAEETDLSDTVSKNDSEISNEDSKQEITSISTHCHLKRESEILLSTAIVQIADVDGNFLECRALLDNGSQSNFMTAELLGKLNLRTNKISLPVLGVNKMATMINRRTHTGIKSCYNDFKTDISFLILDKITTNIPTSSFDGGWLQIPTKLRLADPDYNISNKIDILLGASIFFELLSQGQLKLGLGKPVLQNSQLGWIIAGPMSPGYPKGKKTLCNLSINQGIQEQLEKFWSIEECSSEKIYSNEEIECEQSFLDTVRRDDGGRFIVTLPIRDHIGELGDSVKSATKRFFALERKLTRNPEIKQQYCNFMTEYETLGHMTRIIEGSSENKTMTNTYYLPHHAVINNSSSTTKLRVVFDGSAKTTSGVSLNDLLMVGPTIQEDILSILLRFRKHNVVITADIAKMYRQVIVAEEQRDLQRILWRSKTSDEVNHYRCNTLTYGTATASFLAIRCLQQTAVENVDSFPEASKVILKDFYVDDLISGADTVENAIKLKHDVTSILSQGGFSLRKWLSNNRSVLEEANVNSSEADLQYYIDANEGTKKTLGIFWNAKSDNLEYIVHQGTGNSKVTKRIILSIISQIFDPLGLVGPCTIQAKMILQHIWQLRLGWDEVVPKDLFSSWLDFYDGLSLLNEIKIPRQIVIKNVVNMEIHGFCDASEKAYGCCIYARTTNRSGGTMVQLLCAKSKVAPLKTISLPRLELCGALLLARLMRKVKEALDTPIQKTYFWCDSEIVLAWLRAQPSAWKTFIANRVSEIQKLTDIKEWRHISSKENPADIISRGVSPSTLRNLHLWWSGPQFIKHEPEVWPNYNDNDVENIPEKRSNVVLASTVPDRNIFLRYSSLYKLQRTIALCLRFRNNLTKHKTKITGDLSVDELNRSLIKLIKCMQENEFSTEIKALKNNQDVPKASKLFSLNPFLDTHDQIIRVGGRLTKANLSDDVKFPIVLPDKHPLSRLIILNEHHKNLHAGTQAILANLRQRYWLLNGRRTVRSVLRRCITCFRVKPTGIIRKMGDLPSSRITPNRPFLISGVDCAGPFALKDGKRRNRVILKAYICIFVCFSTKAVHIELLGDLSTNSFLNALKRFTSRRGICSTLYSDNGTNFVGANRKLKEINDYLKQIGNNREINEFCSKNEINWRFIPPKSPHQGGLWESAVKAAKYHAVRVIGNAHLTFEELSTIFTQIEAVLNSRPLTPLSSDPHDLLALTPGHFLIGDSLVSIPQEDVTSISSNRLNQYRRLQQMVQHFWVRWSQEYLTSLQQRTKWRVHQPDGLRVGSMVVLKDDNVMPLNWRLGRIVELHPGQDDVTRVVTVKTNGGLVKRSVQKLCLLPLDDDSQSN